MEAEDGSVHLSLQTDSQRGARLTVYSESCLLLSCHGQHQEACPRPSSGHSVLWMGRESRGLDIALGWVAAPLELRVSPARMMRIPARVAQEVDKLGSAW